MEYQQVQRALKEAANDINQLDYLLQNNDNNLLYLNLLEQDSSIFDRFKKEKLSLDITMKAIYEDGELLEFIPDEFKSRELCFIAIANSFSALRYVPEKHLDQSFIDLILSSRNSLNYWIWNSNHKNVFKDLFNTLPKALLQDWHYHKLVGINGMFLQFIPRDFITVD